MMLAVARTTADCLSADNIRRYRSCRAVEVGGRRTVHVSIITEPSTMLAFAIPLGFLGIGVFCWLMFAAAIYALPFGVGVTVFLYTQQAGAGALGAILLGVIAGAFVLVIGRTVFSLLLSPILRIAIALIFAIPAAVAGYSTTSGLFGLTGASDGWRLAFACLGAIAVGTTAWRRLAMPPPIDVGHPRRPAPSWGRAHRTRRWAHAVDLSNVDFEIDRPLLRSTVTGQHGRRLLERPRVNPSLGPLKTD